MSGRRHHEVAPGGNGETNRNHYEGDERKENRRNRVEKRKAAREHFRNERSEIREEIDMTRAGLAKRLHVQLATVEMLKIQLKEESIGFELPDNYEAIRSRIQKLANGSDNNINGEALYEGNASKRDRRRNMKNDLQILRLTARGLRSSLRRHVNHVEDEPVADTEPTAPRPVSPGERPPSAPSKPKDRVELEDKEKDEEEAPKDKEPDGSDDPEPATASKPTVATGSPDSPTVVPTPSVDRVGEGGEELDDKTDNPAPPRERPEAMNDPYLGIVTDVPAKLRDDYEMPANEASKFDDPKFKEWFKEKYTQKERTEIMQELEAGDKDNADGRDRLVEAYEKYEASLIPEDASKSIEDKFTELNKSADLGLTANPIENGLELSLNGVETKIQIINRGGLLHIELPDTFSPLIKESTAIYKAEHSNEAILDARRLLREIAFIESHLYTSSPESGYESAPYTVSGDGKNIIYHRGTWPWVNSNLDWANRGGNFQADEFVNIHLVTEALNNYYFEKNPDIERPATPELDLEALVAENDAITLDESKTKLTLTDGDRNLEAKLSEGKWTIDLPYQSLVSSAEALTFTNDSEGLKRGLARMKNLAEWMNHIDMVIKDNEAKFTTPPSLKMNPSGDLMSNGIRLTPLHETGPTHHGEGTVTKESYTSALIGQIQLQVEGVKEDEYANLKHEIARERHRFTNIPHATVTESENGFTAKIGEFQVSALKTNDQWDLSYPEELSDLVSQAFPQHTDSLSELSSIYQDATVLMNAYNVATKMIESSGDRGEMVKHGGPLYLEDTWYGENAIRISEDYNFYANTLGLASAINKTEHSDISQFVRGFNEDYLADKPQLKADILAKQTSDSNPSSEEELMGDEEDTGEGGERP